MIVRVASILPDRNTGSCLLVIDQATTNPLASGHHRLMATINATAITTLFASVPPHRMRYAERDTHLTRHRP